MSIRRTEVQKAIKMLDEIRDYTRMSPEKIAELPQEWRKTWMSSPLSEVIDLLETEIKRSLEKKDAKKSTNTEKA